MKRNIAMILAAFFVSGIAYAADDEMSSYDDWDSDGDSELSDTEFQSGYEDSGIYDEWDTNADGSIDEDEFGEGLFDYYDADDSGSLDEDEWDEWNEEWYDVW